MRKSELISALEKIHGDPEIEVKGLRMRKKFCSECGEEVFCECEDFLIDRINEYPRPEIVVIEK